MATHVFNIIACTAKPRIGPARAIVVLLLFLDRISKLDIEGNNDYYEVELIDTNSLNNLFTVPNCWMVVQVFKVLLLPSCNAVSFQCRPIVN